MPANAKPAARGHLSELALEVGLEGHAVRVALVQVALQRRVVHPGVEVV